MEDGGAATMVEREVTVITLADWPGPNAGAVEREVSIVMEGVRLVAVEPVRSLEIWVPCGLASTTGLRAPGVVGTAVDMCEANNL